MSPQLNYQIARARQNEIDAAIIHAHHRADAESITKPRRPVTRRIVQAVVPVGACLAATAGIMVSGAHADPRPIPSSGHAVAQRVARETRALEAKGYVPVACVVGGTLMRNAHTGRSMLVRW